MIQHIQKSAPHLIETLKLLACLLSSVLKTFLCFQDGYLVTNNTAYVLEPSGKLANTFKNNSHYLRKRSAGITSSKWALLISLIL